MNFPRIRTSFAPLALLSLCAEEAGGAPRDGYIFASVAK